MVNLEQVKSEVLGWLETVMGWLVSPQFYAQVGAIIVAAAVARIAGRKILTRLPLLSTEPVSYTHLTLPTNREV